MGKINPKWSILTENWLVDMLPITPLSEDGTAFMHPALPVIVLKSPVAAFLTLNKFVNWFIKLILSLYSGTHIVGFISPYFQISSKTTYAISNFLSEISVRILPEGPLSPKCVGAWSFNYKLVWTRHKWRQFSKISFPNPLFLIFAKFTLVQYLLLHIFLIYLIWNYCETLES